MKSWLFFPLLFFCLKVKAQLLPPPQVIAAGEMFYTNLGIVTNGETGYRFTVRLYKNCINTGGFANISLSVFDKLTYARVRNPISLIIANRGTENLNEDYSNKCMINPPSACYNTASYYVDVSLPPSMNGYIISCAGHNRASEIISFAEADVMATYTAEIPANAEANNSARIDINAPIAICANSAFTYNFVGTDDDGDELRYHLVSAYEAGLDIDGKVSSLAPPPFKTVAYSSGFNGSAPLGANVIFDEKSGTMKGIAPGEGRYGITISIGEYRNGILIATQRKEIQVIVTNCTVGSASLLPEYMVCTDNKTIKLSNLTTSPLVATYNWKLYNSTGTVLHVKSTQTISYEFADTGVYHVKLLVNKGLECFDSTTSIIRVYPGLKTDFDFYGTCYSKPTVFNNKSTTLYGQLNYWKWDFGDNTYGGKDVTEDFNPTYQYQSMWSKKVSLMVGTTKGCRDTLRKIISIFEKPQMTLAFRDTLICVNDTVQLGVSAKPYSLPGSGPVENNGTFSWSPSINMISSVSKNPVVSPAVTTMYHVMLDDKGCVNSDSVRVRVASNVSLKAMNDTTICQGDSIQLKVISDGFRYVWSNVSPANATLKNPVTVAEVSTLYEVMAFIGNCSVKDEIRVTTIPYPKVNAGSDKSICYNATVQLIATTDGASFSWLPAATLNQTDILNPTARPQQTTSYVILALDTKGCPKPGRDTVTVTVLPEIRPFAGRDTAAVVGQPLQLYASGGTKYNWSPAFGLSNVNIPNPIASYSSPSDGLRYKVVIFNDAGCSDSAYLNIKVFETIPGVYVPTIFTPNGDGKNDVLRPIALSMKIEYFHIYNRWGKLVFSTKGDGNGWNGSINGSQQGTGVFVWVIKAFDNTGKAYLQKGTVTLIR